MARGGKREGAGRKQDAVTVASKEAANEFIASKRQTPLDVMLEAMEYAMSQVRKTENVLEKKIFYEAAHAHAKDAAPYIHAKLASMEVKNPEGETFRTSQSLTDSDKELINRTLQQLKEPK